MSKEKSKREQFRLIAKRLLEEAGGAGISSRKIKNSVYQEAGINENTSTGSWNHFSVKKGVIDSTEGYGIVKIEKGLYRLAKFANDNSDTVEDIKEDIADKKLEQYYYPKFAKFLVEDDDVERCSNAITLEERIFNDQWGNPDVIGIKQFAKGLSSPKIITAEIKVSQSTKDILKGFGQSCAYKLFSHKVYLVIPSGSNIEQRIFTLCIKFNIGLVLFNLNGALDDIHWEVKNEPTYDEPDYDYVESMLEGKSKGSKLFKLFKPYI